MILTKKELAALVQGAISIEYDEEGYLIPHRMTEKQREFYKPREKAYARACATPNVRLAFQTNADNFSIDYRITCGIKCFFDLFVDGALVWHCGDVLEGGGKGTFHFDLPEGTHDVVLYLPFLSRASLANLTVPDGATVTPLPFHPTMLLLGDSITQGAVASYPSNTYANRLADMLGFDAVNQAVSGEIFRPDMIDGELGFTPKIITVAYGTNDFAKCENADELTKNATEYYRRLRATFPEAKLFSILPIWCAGHGKLRPAGSFSSVRQIIRTAAEAVGATVIDTLNFVPHLPEFFYDQRLHPNDLGFLHYASALYRAILPHVKEL
jgi:lysophospholipase L1-like esterase